jgi:hypothetical protein
MVWNALGKKRGGGSDTFHTSRELQNEWSQPSRVLQRNGGCNSLKEASTNSKPVQEKERRSNHLMLNFFPVF